MRKQWWTVGALIAAAGCAGTGFPGTQHFAQNSGPQNLGQQSQLAASLPQGPAATQNASWTQRITSKFVPGSAPQPTQQNQTAAAAQANRQKLDPISLGFAAGPPNAELYLSMAQLSDRGGNTQHARTMYQRTIAMEPDNLDALLGLARLEDRQGNLDEALKIYHQAAMAHSENAMALNDLALCFARKGNLNASLQLLDQAVRLQPQKPLYRNNIAKVLTELKRIDDAVSHLAAVHPPAIAQYNMGVLLHQRNRTEEAVRFLTAATHIDPQLQPAKDLLAEVSGGSTTLAANDPVLPTPMQQPGYAPASGAQTPYPSTGITSNRPLPQSMPGETAQVPVGNSPVLLPPVR